MTEIFFGDVFYDEERQGWFFWDETNSYMYGPFFSQFRAEKAFKEYRLELQELLEQ